jgi:hypothetical protein
VLSKPLLVVVRLLLVRLLVVRLVPSRSSLRWLVAVVVGWLAWVDRSLAWLVGHSVVFVAECRPDSLLVGSSPVRI